ncbi:class I SAM-dependent methyltransferase [Variovorax sp.]|uniref:class I SAM-dependent methyltransferase n=1 Tax=Variovorax sp. TaxID=1871043 RepID=UPI002D442DB4|nr:class I SAM-dependent methyltransferase [Variovorax sp.]HYP82112.1 class I SAM-dependent methyltransferase [Variovorax sp.]
MGSFCYAHLDRYISSGFNEVEGWCSSGLAEICKLIDTSQRTHSVHLQAGVAEIGIHHGLFFILLNSLCEEDVTSWAIDVFENQALNVDQSGRGSREAFTRNLERFDRHNGRNVRVLECDSTTVRLRDLVTSPIRIFSIDGGHTVEHTVSDLHAAQSVLHPEGVVILDDITNAHWLGVIEGCMHFLHSRTTLVPFAIGHNKLFLCNLSYAKRYGDLFRDSPFVAKESVRFCGWDIVAMDVPVSTTAVTDAPVRVEAAAVESELRTVRGDEPSRSSLAPNVAKLVKFDYEKYPKRLNLGCGYDVRPGYLNVDLHERHGPDLVADVTSLDMLPDGEFVEIVAQDVLEHVERHKVHVALKEWARLLAPEGILQVQVPSLELMFRMLAHPNNRQADEAAKVIHLMYGTQAYTGDYHLSGFTAPVLEKHLNDVGLQICRADIAHGWCFNVYARKTEELTDPCEYVYSSYFRVLGRAADPDGLTHYVREVQAGMPREQVIRELETSEEGRILREMPFYLLGHVSADRRLINDGQRALPAPTQTRPTVRQALRQLKAAMLG